MPHYNINAPLQYNASLQYGGLINGFLYFLWVYLGDKIKLRQWWK